MARLLRFLKRVFHSAARDDLFTLAASISYAAILSIFPLLIGLVALASRFMEQVYAQQVVIEALSSYLPPDVLDLVRGILDASISTWRTAGVLSLVGLFWSATAVAGALRHGLNRVLRAPGVRPFWHRKVVELMLVILGGILINLSFITSGVLAVLGRVGALATAMEMVRRTPLFNMGAAIAPWVFSGMAFLVVYRFLPNVRLRWSTLWIGSVMSLLLFEVTKRAFLWYLQTLAKYPLVYGPLAGVVVFMIWVYLAALVVLFGAEVMAQLEESWDPSSGPSFDLGRRA
ncbi:MAG: YihY/virulence factor BrkB family protein [Armatimonadota bacterium]|nr:YihY/virulence factor BrkB family protein [Armatimonadota bacterium]MDR5702858.1 YihY/virulence factor BrkB family protein [Armatimonadota bacterium]